MLEVADELISDLAVFDEVIGYFGLILRGRVSTMI